MFIEITLVEKGEEFKTLMNTNEIRNFIKDGSTCFVLLCNNGEPVEVKESYQEIKELLINTTAT